MADPLSIIASVVGLIDAAAKISKALYDVITSMIDAPHSSILLLMTVRDVENSLKGLKPFLETLPTIPEERRELVHLEHLLACLTSCILTLSELEDLATRKLVQDGSLRRRFVWVWYEKKVAELLARMEPQKTCLILMLNVFQSNSAIQASRDSDRLAIGISKILEQNHKALAKIVELEAKLGQSATCITNPGDQYEAATTTPYVQSPPQSIEVIRTSTLPREFQLPELTITGSTYSFYNEDDGASFAFSDATTLAPSSEFDTVLSSSKVYTRLQQNESNVLSARRPTFASVTSSILSQITLRNLDVVEEVRLPITLADINKFGPGLTFASLLLEPSGSSYSNTIGNRSEKARVQNSQSAVYLTARIPRPGSKRIGRGKQNKVKKIIFTIRSHDQGWASTPTDMNAVYSGCWSWLEVEVYRRSRFAAPETEMTKVDGPHVLQHNVRGKSEATEHKIVWTDSAVKDRPPDLLRLKSTSSSDPEKEFRREGHLNSNVEFVRRLRPGDELRVVMCCRYAGWTCTVESCKIEVILGTE